MTSTRKISIRVLLFAGAVLSAGWAQGAAAAPQSSTQIPKTEQILSAVDAPLSAVTVMGRRRTVTDMVRLDTSSASSCGFMTPGIRDLEAYEDGLRHIGFFVPRAGDPRFFSPNSSYGDASTGYSRGAFGPSIYSSAYGGDYGAFGGFDNYGSVYSQLLSDCSPADFNFAAHRARLLARDKTLPQAYALYDQGRYDEAMAMFDKSYRKLPGDAMDEAALMIGRIYIERASNPADAPRAVPWLKRAATGRYPYRIAFNPKDPYQGFRPQAEAAAVLGKMYLVGYGVQRDPALAAKWFNRAVDHGHVPAAKILGDLYFYGQGVERNEARAIGYYREAAKRGFAPAQNALGDAYYYGAKGVSPNMKTAITWYSQAAALNNASSLYALAYAYDAGEGVDRDPQRAIGYYKTAALAGSAPAQTALGVYFYKGELVPVDHVAARRWFEEASRRGDVEAMFNLAAMQSKGEGGPKDMAKAYAWMDIARRGGHPRASQALAALDGRMDVADRRAAEALIRPRSAE